jgi:endonuclease V-like protein UPF0215 family
VRPHVLGIDDGPFALHAGGEVPIVGVMTEGPDLVEGIAVTRFPVDGDGVTAFLVGWVTSLRLHPALQAIVLGGVTIAGLAIVDLAALAAGTGVPAIAVLERTPPAVATPAGVYVACAGCTAEEAVALVRACCGKAGVPEPLRLAHMMARAIVDGESHGRA